MEPAREAFGQAAFQVEHRGGGAVWTAGSVLAERDRLMTASQRIRDGAKDLARVRPVRGGINATVRRIPEACRRDTPAFASPIQVMHQQFLPLTRLGDFRGERRESADERMQKRPCTGALLVRFRVRASSMR
jgi:hypothetical protein